MMFREHFMSKQRMKMKHSLETLNSIGEVLPPVKDHSKQLSSDEEDLLQVKLEQVLP